MERRTPSARLHAEMACDTAFRLIARRCLDDLKGHQAAAGRGEPEAVHRMRLAVARLRTAILFFSPMVADAERSQIRDGLKWLNAELGAVRDLDVAIDRLKDVDARQRLPARYFKSWHARLNESRRHLVRALRSARYRNLIESISGWIDRGEWSAQKTERARQRRARPVSAYSLRRLTRWQQKLLKKCRDLPDMSARKRHRLRLLNKKISYSIEFFNDLLDDRKFAVERAALKHLRKAQRCLGRLNDDVNGHALATAMQRDGVAAHPQFLSPKRERRLTRDALAAYRKLAELKA